MKKMKFLFLLRTIAKENLKWGSYTATTGKNAGKTRKALVLPDGHVVFISSKLTQQDVRDKYDVLVVSDVDDAKVCHMPGISADEAF